MILFLGACTAGCPSVCMGDKLAAVNWNERNLQGAFLVGSDLRNASLGNTNLSNADLSRVDLSGANLSSANLTNARLIGCNLNNASLTGAILSETDFSGASLVSADLTGETLTSTQLTSVDFTSALLVGADMSQLDLSASTLNYAKMAGINLNRSILAGGIIDKADLSGADLRYADLGGAWINLSNLVSANLQNANLSGASLIGTDLRGADLRGADLNSAVLIASPDMIKLENQEDSVLRNMSETQWAKLDLGDTHLEGVKYDNHTIWPAGFSVPGAAIYQPDTSSSPAVRQIVLTGSIFTYEYIKPAIKLFMRDYPDTFFVLNLSDSAIGIQYSGSGGEGLGLSSRRLTQIEKNQYPDLKEIQIGADKLCVVVNLDNPVEQLTLSQLSSIYSGLVHNWSEIGGADLAAKPLAAELFTSLLLEIVKTDVAKFTSLPSQPGPQNCCSSRPGSGRFFAL